MIVNERAAATPGEPSDVAAEEATAGAAELQGKGGADLYRHYKGGLYRKIGNAFHTETEEDLTLYVTVGAEDRVWARPTAMFNGTTPDCQRRFVPVSPTIGDAGQRPTSTLFRKQEYTGDRLAKGLSYGNLFFRYAPAGHIEVYSLGPLGTAGEHICSLDRDATMNTVNSVSMAYGAGRKHAAAAPGRGER